MPHAAGLAEALGATLLLVMVVSHYVDLENLLTANLTEGESNPNLAQMAREARLSGGKERLSRVAARLASQGAQARTALHQGVAMKKSCATPGETRRIALR